MQSSIKFPGYLLDWLLLLMQIFLNPKDIFSAKPSFINWSPFQPSPQTSSVISLCLIFITALLISEMTLLFVYLPNR